MLPTLTFEQLGILFVSILVLAQFYFGWKQNQRDETRDREPRATPPNHQVYATKAEHAELKARVDNLAGKMEQYFMELDRKRSVSIAGLHDDLRDRIEGLRLESKADIQGVSNRINDLLEAIGELKGRQS